MGKLKHKWGNRNLLNEFHRLNGQYFGGRLEVPLKLAFCPIDSLGHTFRYRSFVGNKGQKRSKDDPFGIHIDSGIRYSKRLWAGTLLHEMVHLEQKNKYSCKRRGKRFNERMTELAVAGAFRGIW